MAMTKIETWTCKHSLIKNKQKQFTTVEETTDKLKMQLQMVREHFLNFALDKRVIKKIRSPVTVRKWPTCFKFKLIYSTANIYVFYFLISSEITVKASLNLARLTSENKALLLVYFIVTKTEHISTFKGIFFPLWIVYSHSWFLFPLGLFSAFTAKTILKKK